MTTTNLCIAAEDEVGSEAPRSQREAKADLETLRRLLFTMDLQATRSADARSSRAAAFAQIDGVRDVFDLPLPD